MLGRLIALYPRAPSLRQTRPIPAPRGGQCPLLTHSGHPHQPFVVSLHTARALRFDVPGHEREQSLVDMTRSCCGDVGTLYSGTWPMSNPSLPSKPRSSFLVDAAVLND